MSRAIKNLLLPAVAFLLLYFGAGGSAASAWDGGFHGRFYAPGVRIHVRATHFAPRARFFYPAHRAFSVRPYHRPYFRPYPRPYRLARVFVYDPYPRYVHRRVAFGAGDPYCVPY